MVEGFIQPHFGVGFGDVVVDPGGEVFHVFSGPAADELAVLFAPADAETGGNGAVVLNARSVGGHDHFQHGTVLEVFFHFVHGQDVAVEFLGKNRGIGDNVEVFNFCLQQGGIVAESFKGLRRDAVIRFANTAGNKRQGGISRTKSGHVCILIVWSIQVTVKIIATCITIIQNNRLRKTVHMACVKRSAAAHNAIFQECGREPPCPTCPTKALCPA